MLTHTHRDGNVGNGSLAHIAWLLLQTIPLGFKELKKDKVCNWKVCNYEVIIIIITDVISRVENANV